MQVCEFLGPCGAREFSAQEDGLSSRLEFLDPDAPLGRYSPRGTLQIVLAGFAHSGVGWPRVPHGDPMAPPGAAQGMTDIGSIPGSGCMPDIGPLPW